MKETVYPKKIDKKKGYVPFLDWYFMNIRTRDTLPNIITYIKEHQILGYHMSYKSLETRSFAQTIRAHAPRGHFMRKVTMKNGKCKVLWMRAKDYDKTLKGSSWQTEEKEYLKKHWQSMTDAELSNHINRSTSSIQSKRVRLGCYRREPAGMGAK